VTRANANLKFRPDLICKQIRSGNRQVWVVKDPLSRTYSYFDQAEYAMLELADGSRTVDQLIRDCQALVAPRQISPDAVVQFYTSAHVGGIVLSGGAAYQAAQSSNRRWWKNPLAIRIPGINPDRFLDRLFGNLGEGFVSGAAQAARQNRGEPSRLPDGLRRSATKLGGMGRKPSGNARLRPDRRACALPLLVLDVTLIIVALVIAVVYFTELAVDFASASSNLMTGHRLVWLMIVVSVTKIIHELAHAIACKFFGGDVLEMGVMLFVGTPCLYCDVSDVWLIEQRWKRVFVSAAGILAELTIAAIATIVWLFAADGFVSDLCVIIKSVKTTSGSNDWHRGSSSRRRQLRRSPANQAVFKPADEAAQTSFSISLPT